MMLWDVFELHVVQVVVSKGFGTDWSQSLVCPCCPVKNLLVSDSCDTCIAGILQNKKHYVCEKQKHGYIIWKWR